MTDQRLDDLELRVTAITERLARIENRLDDLTMVPTRPEAPGNEEIRALDSEAGQMREGSLSSLATHLGLTLLIFGGAYLLRAITDMGWLPSTGGVILGAVYALAWLALASRIGGDENRRTTALFYGIAAVLMAMPLAIEATTRFQLVSGGQSALLVVLFIAFSLAVAGWRDLRALAWLTTLAGTLIALVLLRATHTASPFALILLLLGVASYWLVEARNWRGLQWAGAASADIGVGILALLVTTDRWSVGAGFVGGIAAVFMVAYLAGFAIRSHVWRRPVRTFEVAQSILAIALAYWALSASLRVGTHSPVLFGILSLLAGVGAYILAFTPETRTQRGRNFFFYSALGLVLVVGGSSLLLSPSLAAVLWSLLAVMMAVFSGRYGRVTLSLQTTFLLFAAGLGSQALRVGWRGLTGDGTASWPSPGPFAFMVAAATVLCLFIPVAQRSERWGRLAGMPQLTVLLLSVWEVGGLIVVAAAPAIAGVPGAAADLGALAALRTFVLSASAVTLAVSSRHRRWPVARWLAYPVLGLLGVRLLLEGFPHGRPLTLFLALALVGAALILVARLLHVDHHKTADREKLAQ